MPQQNPTPDSWLYSGLFHSLGSENRSFRSVVKNILNLFKMLANLGQRHKLAEERLEQLQQQVDKIETNIRISTMPTAGTRLNKLR